VRYDRTDNTDAADALKRACGNLADDAMVLVPRWAAWAGAQDREDTAVEEALKECEAGWQAEMDEMERRHDEALETLREDMQERISELEVLL
jgi:inorganic triphosphatase YgiF